MASNNQFYFSVVLIDRPTQGLSHCVIFNHICSHSCLFWSKSYSNQHKCVSVLVWMLDLLDFGDEGSPAHLRYSSISHLLCFSLCSPESTLRSELMWITICTAPPAGCVCICHSHLLQTTVHHFHSQHRIAYRISLQCPVLLYNRTGYT